MAAHGQVADARSGEGQLPPARLGGAVLRREEGRGLASPDFDEIGAFHVPHKGRGCKPGRLTASLGDPIGRGGESPTQGEIPRPLCELRYLLAALAPNIYASHVFVFLELDAANKSGPRHGNTHAKSTIPQPHDLCMKRIYNPRVPLHKDVHIGFEQLFGHATQNGSGCY